MSLTFKNLYDYTERNLKRSLGLETLLEARAGMSIDFPGYSRMRPGDYRTAWFATVFLDIRGSTARAFQIGPQKTFATINALLPTLARVVDEHGGFVVDYPGDGIMAHWELEDISDVLTVKNCIQSCCWMDDAVKSIVNPILEKYSIPPITCGIGAAVGEVVVTKIGIPGYMSAKAIGNSVNLASKYAGKDSNSGEIIIASDMSHFAFDDVQPGSQEPIAYRYVANTDSTIKITSQNLKIPRPTREDAQLELKNLIQSKLRNSG